ncbi:MAG TPA: DUF3857 domain-containing protein [candidate division Zixibacteria bacterium]|nr:DUF3857 domain-containing protein [candidate division Zixibacteria bacterium]
MKIFFTVFFLLTVSISSLAQTDDSLPPGDNPPPTIYSRIENAGTAEDYDDAPYLIVRDSIVNRIDERGISNISSYTLYKILTEEGCKEHAVLKWYYEPISNYVEILKVNIVRGDSLIPVSIENIIDIPAPQSGIYWQDRYKLLQLPRLQVGDGVEIEIFKKGYSYALLDSEENQSAGEIDFTPPMPGEYFDIIVFRATAPILFKKYVLKLSAYKRLQSQVYNGTLYSSTAYNAETTTYAWWGKDIPGWKPERYHPQNTDMHTKVVMATVDSWEAKSRWFFDVNEKQFEFTDAIKDKVDEIFAKAGVTNGIEEEKAFELVHWVAQNIRYSGQTMGEGEGYTLHSGEMIFEQRSGVCKDIAGMLITMMRAAGMDSYGAMTFAGARIDEVPADQFNHCVVALKKSDGSFVMYDPTWVPYDNNIWSLLEAEQHYLVGTPEGENLNRIPYSPPEQSPLMVTNKGRILPDGTFEATMELRSNGAVDGYLRGMLYWFPLSQIGNTLARVFSKAGEQVEIIHFEHGDILDFKTPMWWDIEYRLPQYAKKIGDALEFKSPMMQIIMNNRILFRGAYDWPEERNDDVFLYYTEHVDASETISLPKGYKVAEPEDSLEIDDTYVYFKGSGKMKKNTFTVKQIIDIKRRQIPPEGYEGFRKVIMKGKEYASTVFKAVKGGTK